jgi:hypothetical protein
VIVLSGFARERKPPRVRHRLAVICQPNGAPKWYLLLLASTLEVLWRTPLFPSGDVNAGTLRLTLPARLLGCSGASSRFDPALRTASPRHDATPKIGSTGDRPPSLVVVLSIAAIAGASPASQQPARVRVRPRRLSCSELHPRSVLFDRDARVVDRYTDGRQGHHESSIQHAMRRAAAVPPFPSLQYRRVGIRPRFGRKHPALKRSFAASDGQPYSNTCDQAGRPLV